MADAGELRALNLEAVRRALRPGAAMSKNALAQETGLSFPTVSRTVDALCASGELLERGREVSTGGRCARLFALNPLSSVTLSLRLEAKKLCWFVSDRLGGRLEQGQEDCGAGALQTIDTLLGRVQARYPQLGAVSMGMAGTVRHGTVTEVFGYDELRGVNLLSHLQDRTGLPAVVQGDLHTVALGHWSLRGGPPGATVCIYQGSTCPGSGVVIGGKPWLGASEFAGELAYLPVIERNLERAKAGFGDVDLVDYYGRVILAYAAILNPDRVVLYRNPGIDGRVDEIRRICARGLPAHAIPQIEVSDSFGEDYEHGLFAMARELLDKS